MNGDVCMVSTKEVIRSIDREISDVTGIPLKRVTNISPAELNKILGVREPDLKGNIDAIDAHIQREKEWVEKHLRKFLSKYHRKYGGEEARDYYR